MIEINSTCFTRLKVQSRDSLFAFAWLFCQERQAFGLTMSAICLSNRFEQKIESGRFECLFTDILHLQLTECKFLRLSSLLSLSTRFT